MILEQIGEPTVTITLTVTELKRLRDACGWAIKGLEARNNKATQDIVREQQALQEELRAVLDDVRTIYP